MLVVFALAIDQAQVDPLPGIHPLAGVVVVALAHEGPVVVWLAEGEAVERAAVGGHITALGVSDPHEELAPSDRAFVGAPRRRLLLFLGHGKALPGW
ncbi:hypothetical protein D9M69_687590 [compost metagenome]